MQSNSHVSCCLIPLPMISRNVNGQPTSIKAAAFSPSESCFMPAQKSAMKKYPSYLPQHGLAGLILDMKRLSKGTSFLNPCQTPNVKMSIPRLPWYLARDSSYLYQDGTFYWVQASSCFCRCHLGPVPDWTWRHGTLAPGQAADCQQHPATSCQVFFHHDAGKILVGADCSVSLACLE